MAQEWYNDECLIVPQLVLDCDHLLEQCWVEVKELSWKRRVTTLSKFDAAPLKDNIDWHYQVLRLLCDHRIETGDNLAVLFEVCCEHLLHEFNAKDCLTIMLNLVSLLGLHLIMEPLSAHVLLGTFFLVTRVNNKELVRVHLWQRLLGICSTRSLGIWSFRFVLSFLRFQGLRLLQGGWLC